MMMFAKTPPTKLHNYINKQVIQTTKTKERHNDIDDTAYPRNNDTNNDIDDTTRTIKNWGFGGCCSLRSMYMSLCVFVCKHIAT